MSPGIDFRWDPRAKVEAARNGYNDDSEDYVYTFEDDCRHFCAGHDDWGKML
jgi:hypothetical protein